MVNRRALNPAFAAAHGLAAKKERQQDDGGGVVVAAASGKRLELVLKEARATGKLQATNCGLKSPLPDEVFDLRKGIAVDLSLSASDQPQPSATHDEETLSLVDLSDNELGGHLDDRVLKFQQIQSLRLRRCELTGVPVLASLETLVVLDLSSNQMESLRLDCLPPNLQELDLSNNQLAEILASTEAPVAMNDLSVLNLSENRLTSLDQVDLACPRLREFRCDRNQLTSLPGFLSSARGTLQTIEASNNKMGGNGGLDCSGFSSLKSLSLAVNRLVAPPCIPLGLARLDLTTNKIAALGGLFAAANDDNDQPSSSELVDLLLQDNHLTELDAGVVSRCERVQRLDVSANKLKTLPYQLGFLPQLHHLSLVGNPLFGFRTSDLENTQAILRVLRNRAPRAETSNDGGAVAATTKLLTASLVQNTTLDLSGKGSPGGADLDRLVTELGSAPETALGITGKLLLDGNRLETIPDELLSRLPRLTEVSLNHNALKALPASLVNSCPRLARLEVARNAIGNLEVLRAPPSLAWSKTLVRLNLSTNRLTAFPGEILQKLVALEQLNLAFNKIKDVGDWESVPNTLTLLDLSENALEHADELVLLLGADCPKLEVLKLQHNYLRRIPATLGLLEETCPSLKHLDLKGNPQHAVRPEVLAKPTNDQLLYLRNRLTPDQIRAAMSRIEAIRTGETDSPAPAAASVAPAPAPSGPPPAPADSATTKTATTKTAPAGSAAKPPPVATSRPAIPSDEKENNAATREAAEDDLLATLKKNIAAFEEQLDSPSISQAKRYAVKKNLAMERSKLIREERKRGLRK